MDSISLICSPVKCIFQYGFIKIEHRLIRENDAAFQLGVIGGVLRGHNGKIPEIVPHQGHLGMKGNAPVLKPFFQHLKGFWGHHLDPVIDQEPDRQDLPPVDPVLNLLEGVLRNGVRGHQDVRRPGLPQDMENKAQKVEIPVGVIVLLSSRLNEADAFGKDPGNKLHEIRIRILG